MSTDPMINAVLGPYRITSLISAGGMGNVYLGTHELLGRPVAIKRLRPDLANEELIERFVREAKAATEIRHPGIVEVYDFGYTADGHAYYVMELIDGKPLSRVLAERTFDEAGAVKIAQGIASALVAAHAGGIIHRDLKPDNIMLVPTGIDVRVKILDFGIAKLADVDGRLRTRTGVLLGTPKYMAPEQAREAARIDARADLYSFGCILYEMLVGQPPFVAEGAGEVIAMQMFSEPERPGTRVTVSPAIDDLVMRLLAKEPADRPQTAAETLALLGARPSAVEIPVPAPRPAVPKRSRAPFAIAGLVLLAGGTAAVLAGRREAPVAVPVVEAPPIRQAVPVVEARPEVPAEVVPPPIAPVVKKKPVAKSARIAKPVSPSPANLKTAKDSPIEVDVGELSRPTKTP